MHKPDVRKLVEIWDKLDHVPANQQVFCAVKHYMSEEGLGYDPPVFGQCMVVLGNALNANNGELRKRGPSGVRPILPEASTAPTPDAALKSTRAKMTAKEIDER